MPHVRAHYPDPGIQHGPFRVLPSTAGGYFIYDERRHPAHRRVGPYFKTAKEAGEVAERWVKEGHGDDPLIAAAKKDKMPPWPRHLSAASELPFPETASPTPSFLRVVR